MAIPKGFMKWAIAHFGTDSDKIDIEAEYDSELTIKENKTLFKAKFPTYFSETPKKYDKAEIVEMQRQTNIDLLADRFGISIKLVK